MKKTLKSCIIVLLVVMGLCIASVAVTFFTNLCPPQGPWPMPPWCKGSPVSMPISLATSTPALIEVAFTVTVPYWTEGDVYVGIENNPSFLKLTPYNETIFQGTSTLAKGTVYYYTRGSDQTAEAGIKRQITENRVSDAVFGWNDSSHTVSRPDFQKSFFIGDCLGCSISYRGGDFVEPVGRSMDEMKLKGANWFSMMISWFIIPDYRGNEIKPIYVKDFKGTSGWIGATVQDEDLITIINMAHERDLKVYLCPAIAPEDWGPGVKGKGDLEPSDPDAFFESYKNFINHYADIAQQTGVEMMCVGSEMDTLTQQDLAQNSQIDKAARWRDVIKSAREHYSGLLTYSSSCISEKRCGPQVVKFWDALDVIGWEWYVPIASGAHESIATMKVNAQRIIANNIKPLHDLYHKPVVLTEIGWEAYPGACANTYGVAEGKGGGDRNEQASCYEAVFQAIESADFIQGMHIFVWNINRPGDEFPWIWTDPANQVRFSITEDEIAKWYHYFETP